MSVTVAYVIGILFALAGTVLSFIFIVPAKKRNALPGILRVVHDLFNFKFLVIEKILQALYILSTLFCITAGFFMLFASYQGYYYSRSYAGTGLLVMLVGPIAVRVVYELIMMAVLLVKNVISINGKLKNQNEDAPTDDAFAADLSVLRESMKADAPAEPAAPEVPAGSFCAHCGAPLSSDAAFCGRCGTPK